MKLLGFRTDINELCCCADLFIFPSLQEGLPVALMEAMASGLPCVVSRIRGNTDLIEEGKNGILCNPNKASEFSNAIELLINNKKIYERMKKYSLIRIQKYDICEVEKIIKRIYQEAFE